MTKIEIQKLTEHGERMAVVETEVKFMRGEIKEIKESVRTTNDILSSMADQLVNKNDIKKIDVRVCDVEDKQQKFAWYIGIAVGVGATIMFVVDKVWEVIADLRK